MRLGVVAGRSHPTPEVRGDGQEEPPHCLRPGVAAPEARGGDREQ